MVNYTSPIEATFELQRKSLEQSQQAFQQTVDLPARLGEAAVDGLESQESVQRSVVELQQETLHTLLDTLEDGLSGVEAPTGDLREVIDDQYDVVLDNHAEFFDNLGNGVEEALQTYDEFSAESVEALEDLLDALVELQEELESQSVEAAEEVTEQVEELQGQVEEQLDDLQEQVGNQVSEVQEQVEGVQEQIQDVSEQAADAVDN